MWDCLRNGGQNAFTVVVLSLNRSSDTLLLMSKLSDLQMSMSHLLLQSLGADEVIDYTQEDFAVKLRDQPRFSAILDSVAGETELKSYDLLTDDGTYSHIRWVYGIEQAYKIINSRKASTSMHLARLAEYMQVDLSWHPLRGTTSNLLGLLCVLVMRIIIRFIDEEPTQVVTESLIVKGQMTICEVM